MAYNYSTALNVVARKVPKIVEDQYAAAACNLATSKVWDAFDWPESLAALPPFYLIPGQQDHGPPQPVVPTDFGGLRRAQIQRYNGEVVRDLKVVRQTNEVFEQGVPVTISYEDVKRAFRLYPRVPLGWGAPGYFVTGTYKTLPTQLTPETLTTVLPLKEKYFPMWLEALRYAFYVLDGSDAAGGVTFSNGQPSYNGQYARMMKEIHEARAAEAANLGAHRIYPERALVPSRWNW